MKNKILFFTTIIFFLLINTTYYWEGELVFLAIPAFLLLVIVYIGLIIALIKQVWFLFKERFQDKRRFLLIGLLTTVVLLTTIKPFGFIDFDSLNGNDLLIASAEGGGNCGTTLKLKDNNTFRERNVCFGLTEIKGNYRLINDTIFFENVVYHRQPYEFYKYAIIRPSRFSNNNKLFDLVRYNDLNDTTGQMLIITKNTLGNLGSIKPNR